LLGGGHVWQDYPLDPYGTSIVDERCNYCGKRIYDKSDNMKHNSVQGMGEVIRSYRIAAESDACGGMLPIPDKVRQVQAFLGICPDSHTAKLGILQPATCENKETSAITSVEITQPPSARLASDQNIAYGSVDPTVRPKKLKKCS
jgi:hypothetical protein